MTKTNALRLLDAASIAYNVREYPFSEDELDAVTVALKIGAPPEQVFKTLVTHDTTGEYFVFVIPGDTGLNLKKAALASGKKKIELIPLKELTRLTGYLRGGCSPVGMKKSFPTYIDETAVLFDTIFVSAGVRGMQMEITPHALQQITKAAFVDLV